ncbi:MAG TPA: AAA family ATPase [Solirubrobacteraceae bacterium]|jgi:cell division protease FtsH|nr:AAA family ATPase [Solirubrobacteraceae bacterium]
MSGAAPTSVSQPSGGTAPPAPPAATHTGAAVAAHPAVAQAHANTVVHTTAAHVTAVHTSFAQEIQNWAYNWQPVLMIVFFSALLFVLWRTLKVMPRIKPQQIKPASDQSVSFDDIAGVDEAKAELQEIVEFLREPKRFHALGAQVPKGILLHGPPGTGKTLLAKAVAHESGAQFFAQSAASFVEMFAGLGAARIRRLFAVARKHEPAIIFIDELDAVGGRRGMDISGEKDQTLNQLLVEMDGFSSSGRVVVIAASNLLEKLDPALLRPGRFDRQVFVVPPDVKGRLGVLQVHTRDKPLEGVDLGMVAQQTSGLTGADLANICNEAAIFAARRDGKVITDADFDSAIERVIAGVQSKRVLGDHEKRIVAYHEAGHALCGELLPSVDRVHRISIVPRGRALGYTLNLPAEDRYLKTREELLDYMTVLLGGRVAEQVVFGAITTGASDDLKRVADIAQSMVHDFAMGTAGVGRSPDGDVRLSETTLRIRDEERQDLVEEARRAAQKMILSHRRQLDELARELLVQEVLDREAIERIMDGVPRLERAPGIGLRVVAAAASLPPPPLPGAIVPATVAGESEDERL